MAQDNEQAERAPEDPPLRLGISSFLMGNEVRFDGGHKRNSFLRQNLGEHVDIETTDDAAVYRLNDETAVISTVEFITPPVDDPCWFGQIATNSISEVYSMAGTPLNALNLVMFPQSTSTSGALLLSVPGGEADDLVSGLEEAGVNVAVRVAEVIEGQPGIEVI